MYQVISEFIDASTGQRVTPNEEFSPATPEQAERLIRAGCLVRVGEAPAPESAPADEPAPEQSANDRRGRRRRR